MLTQMRLESEVSVAILDAAERGFAEFGHKGASLRSIASEAGVNQAMIAYYFKSKQGLLDAVIKRRADVINAARRRGLEEVLASDSPTLEDIITVFLRPAMEIARNETPGGYAYIKLLAVLGNSMDAVSQRVITENFDAVAQLFIAAIRDAVPDLTVDGAVRGYLYAFAVGMAAMGTEWRVLDLAGDAFADPSTARMIQDAVAFGCAGIRTLARGSKDRPKLSREKK